MIMGVILKISFLAFICFIIYKALRRNRKGLTGKNSGFKREDEKEKDPTKEK